MVGGQKPGRELACIGLDLDVLRVDSSRQRLRVHDARPTAVSGTFDVAASHREDLPGHGSRSRIVFDDVTDHGMSGTLVEVEAIGAAHRRLFGGGQMNAHIGRESIDVENLELFRRILGHHDLTCEVDGQPRGRHRDHSADPSTDTHRSQKQASREFSVANHENLLPSLSPKE